MTKAQVKVGLVDDHILLRDALANVIRSFDEFTVSLVADNGKEFIEKLNPVNTPEILILDLNMPEMDGHATTHWISKIVRKSRFWFLQCMMPNP